MQISIDVGYSQVKAVSEKGKKILFPAVKADIVDDPTAGMFKQLGHCVYVKRFNSAEEALVGEGALRSLNATTTLAREKSPEIHDLFILTAAYLCGASGFTDLAVGLPLAYYRFQKDELKRRLEKITAHLTIGEGPERYINISRVNVFPQGVGVLLSPGLNIALAGRIAVIDIGYYTTDYLLFEVINGSPVPIPELCGSIDAGIHLASRGISVKYQEKTSALAPKFLLNDMILGKDICFNGRKLDLTKEFDVVLKRNAEQITQSVYAIWSQQADNIHQTVVAGGGSLLLSKYLEFPNITLPDDPVYANAEGFLSMLNYKAKVASREGS